MYRFIIHSSEDRDKEYLAMFTSPYWQDKKNTYASLMQRIPMSSMQGMTYDQVLLAPFDKLVDIYYEYQTVHSSLSTKDAESLKDCFPFVGDIREQIRLFVEKYTDITTTTCPYCDCNEVIMTKQPNIRRDYQLDHYLDKGKCPFVALSLHNFIPVCPLCNQEKSTHTFGGDPAETKSLSPFNSAYDFENKVHFRVKIAEVDDIAKIRSSKTYDDMEISLSYDEDVYMREEERTKILSRYYNNHLSLVHNDLVQFCEKTFSNPYDWFQRLAAKILHMEKEVETFPNQVAHDKGQRIKYDKFKRDIYKQFSIG